MSTISTPFEHTGHRPASHAYPAATAPHRTVLFYLTPRRRASRCTPHWDAAGTALASPDLYGHLTRAGEVFQYTSVVRSATLGVTVTKSPIPLSKAAFLQLYRSHPPQNACYDAHALSCCTVQGHRSADSLFSRGAKNSSSKTQDNRELSMNTFDVFF